MCVRRAKRRDTRVIMTTYYYYNIFTSRKKPVLVGFPFTSLAPSIRFVFARRRDGRKYSFIKRKGKTYEKYVIIRTRI